MRLALNRVREPTAQALMLLDIYSALILQTSMYLVARILPYTRVYMSSYRRAQDGRARQTAQAHSRYKRTCFTGTKVHILTQAAAEEHRATHIPGTIGYKISDVMTDLVNLAVKYLRVCLPLAHTH